MGGKTSQSLSVSGVTIPTDAVLRRLEYPHQRADLKGEVAEIFERMMACAPGLISPQGIYTIHSIKERTEDRVDLNESDFSIESRQVTRMLRSSDPIVFFMVTIGPALEKEVKRLFDEDQMAEAVILDAIGSETADAVADRFHWHFLKNLATENGFSVTPRFSPGYGDWPVSVQQGFLEVCGGEAIGISVNESSLMTPRKSVSAVIGWKNKETGN